MAVIEKHRQANTRDQMEILSMSGEVEGYTTIIIDDVISTGGTIIESATALKAKGAKKVIVCATHGVFANNAVERLEKSPIDKIFVTDSIAQTVKSPKLGVVSVAPLIADCLSQEI